jgi:hypothetical protein
MRRFASIAIAILMIVNILPMAVTAMPAVAGTVTVVVQDVPGVAQKAIARTGGYIIQLDYTLGENALTQAEPTTCGAVAPDHQHGIKVKIPNNFPVPSANNLDEGYITAVFTVGGGAITPVYTDGMYAYFYFNQASAGDVITVRYGDPANGLTMPERPNRYTFSFYARISDNEELLCPGNMKEFTSPTTGFQTVTPSPQVYVLTNMTPATLTFDPNTELTTTEMTVQFTLGAGEERSLYQGDIIRIQLDYDAAAGAFIADAAPGFVPRTTQVPLSINKEYVKVNGSKCSVSPTITQMAGGNYQIDVFIPRDIRCSNTSGRSVKIEFAKEANIVNGAGSPFERNALIQTLRGNLVPVEPNPDVSDGVVDGFLTSTAYRIGSVVSSPAVTVTPNEVGENAAYTIGLAPCGDPGSLQFGNNGTLLKNNGTISFQFPSGTTIPSSISPGTITVDNISTASGPTVVSKIPQVSRNTITIQTPVDINAGDCIVVQFLNSAHIENPSVGDDNYYINIWTSQEPTVISSMVYSIVNPGWARVNVSPNISFTDAYLWPGSQSGYGLPPPPPPPSPWEHAKYWQFYNTFAQTNLTSGAKYTIQFSLPQDATITANTSNIDITFDQEYSPIFNNWFAMPAPNPWTNPSQYFSVNGVQCGFGNVTYNVANRAFRIISPVSVNPEEQLTITISEGFGLYNPDLDEETRQFQIGIDYNASGANPGDNPIPDIMSDSYLIKTEINDVQHQVLTPVVNEISGWTVSFNLGDKGNMQCSKPNLIPGDTIEIMFPSGVSLPTTSIPGGTIRINTWSAGTYFIQNAYFNGDILYITVPSSLGSIVENERVTIMIPETIAIKNPSSIASLSVAVRTSSEPTWVYSNPENIGTKVQTVGVTVTPNTSESRDDNCQIGSSEISIQFKIGSSGSLSAGDFVLLSMPLQYDAFGNPIHPSNGFDPGPLLPQIPSGSLLLNGIPNASPLTWFPRGSSVNGGNWWHIAIPVQTYLAAGSHLDIQILADAGIINPTILKTPTLYTMEISTSREPAWIQTPTFDIVEKICIDCSDVNHQVQFGHAPSVSITDLESDVEWNLGFQIPSLIANAPFGSLDSGIDKITIEFPPSISLPAYVDPLKVGVRNVSPGPFTWCSEVTTNGNNLIITTPIDITVPLVQIRIRDGSGILTPSIPGNHTLKIWTSALTTPVDTCPFTVRARGITQATVVPITSHARPSGSINNAPNTEYTITFNVGAYGALSVGDEINIQFVGNSVTQVAPDFAPTAFPADAVTVNGIQCKLPVTYNETANLFISIKTPVPISPGGEVKVVLTKGCRIKNPLQPSTPNANPDTVGWPEEYLDRSGNDYFVEISTNKEITPIQSKEYEILPQAVCTRPEIVNDPCMTGATSDYSISIYTHRNINAGGNIRVRFPEGFYLPNNMASNMIRVNGKLCTEKIDVEGYNVTIPIPEAVNAYDLLTIDFDSYLGLQNPDIQGKHIIYASVGSAGTWVGQYYEVCESRNISKLQVSNSSGRVTSVTIPQGGVMDFSAQAFDEHNVAITKDVLYSWMFVPSAGSYAIIGHISPLEGRMTTFTAGEMGDGTLYCYATYGNKTISTSVDIMISGEAMSLIISPGGQMTLVKDECYTYSAQLYDDNSPPHMITNGVVYSWDVSNENVAKATPATGQSTQLCPIASGSGVITCKAVYNGKEVIASSDFMVKEGIFALRPRPTDDLGQLKVGQVSTELYFELVDENGAPKFAEETMNVSVESTSPTSRFSEDKINWSGTNKIELQIVKGFSQTQYFYFSDSAIGNVSMTASSPDVVSGTIRVRMMGPSANLTFTNPYRITSAGSPTEKLTLSMVDEYGLVSPPSSDITIQLTSHLIVDGVVSQQTSSTGEFSLSKSSWSNLSGGLITMRAGQQTIDVFYRDTFKGKYSIKATSVFNGMATQTLEITDETGVEGNLTVTVENPIENVDSNYSIDFRTGYGGEMSAGVDHIYLKFPQGTVIPSLSKADITVNGTPCQQSPVIDTTNNTIDLVTPVSINNTEDVRVDIARIINPPEGTYSMQVWTSSQPKVVPTRVYEIGISTVQNLRVSVNPSSVGLSGAYTIEFKTGASGQLNIADEIIIQFPVGTVVPSAILADKIEVNGVLCTVPPMINGLQMTIKNPMPIQNGQDVAIVIDDKAGIKNPVIPKPDYTLKLATTSDSKFVDSLPYEIGQLSTLQNVQVKVEPPTVSKSARYQVSFQIGQNGGLFGGDIISIQMNDQTLPTAIPKLYVTVNGVNPANDIIIDGKRLEIELSQGIAPGQNAVVIIEAKAGIKNPTKPGNDYRLSVFTTKEPYAVASEPFSIESEIVVSYSIIPSTPDGDMGWYKTAPMITLSCNVSADIMYRYEGGQYQTYTGPFTVTQTGHVVIYYKAISITSQTESLEKDIVLKYDPTEPEVEFPDFTSGEKLQVKTGSHKICGSVSDSSDVKLTMNGSPVSIGSDGSFCVDVALVSGENTFEFCATDYAGNKVCQTIVIEKKDKPPVFVIDEPSFMARVSDTEFPYDSASNTHQLKVILHVKGSTESGIAQVVITPKTVAGESHTISVNPDGSFEGDATFNAIGGLNEYEAVVTDTLGNVATQKIKPIVSVDFRLPIDQTTATLNGDPVSLLAAPYISESWRTMVPFRVMGEAIGAEIGWDGNSRTASFTLGNTTISLKIGSNKATVVKGGVSSTVTLDAPAVIKNGSTMVPFRFVAENFGATVTWDGNTRTAMMVYPK